MTDLATMLLGGLGSLAAGWLSGALANYASDVLPMVAAGSPLDDPETPPLAGAEARSAAPVACRTAAPGSQAASAPAAASAARRPALWHYLTLPWYLALRGRCPHCGEARPWRAPAVELGAIVLFLAAWLRFAAQPLMLAAVWIYGIFLLVVLVVDFEHRLVLNVMLAPAAAVAVLVSFLPGFPGPIGALFGGVSGLLLFLLLALVSRGHMGAGDVKLAGVIGLMLGFPDGLTALLTGVIFGGLAAILLLLTRRAGRKSYMAYAPYLSLGALAVLLRIIGQ